LLTIEQALNSSKGRQAAEGLPPLLRGYFDPLNPDAVFALLLTTPHTGRKHLFRRRRTPARRADGSLKTGATGKQLYDYLDTSKAKGIFRIAIMDEAHVFRNPHSQIHCFVRPLDVPLKVFVMATPILNDMRDLAGLLRLAYSPEEEVASWRYLMTLRRTPIVRRS
jgi:hypothetical protein